MNKEIRSPENSGSGQQTDASTSPGLFKYDPDWREKVENAKRFYKEARRMRGNRRSTFDMQGQPIVDSK